MAKTTAINETDSKESEKNISRPICGIIMPIANTEGYQNGHWQDVYSILSEAATDAGFHPNLVSFDSDVGVIQKRIIQNIYTNPIVICDISSRNANVMFELGMRLAFDKPTIIVKDEITPYSFDISSIEHLNYPADLRFKAINEFQTKLADKIKTTQEKSLNDQNYSTFLRSYGSFEVVKIQEEEVSETKFILSQLAELKSIILEKNKPLEAQPIDRREKTYRLDARTFDDVSHLDHEEIIKRIESRGFEVLSVTSYSESLEIIIRSNSKNRLPTHEYVVKMIKGQFS